MDIAIGLSASDLTARRHHSVKIAAAQRLLLTMPDGISRFSSQELEFKADGRRLKCSTLDLSGDSISITTEKGPLRLLSLSRPGLGEPPAYVGRLQLTAENNQVLVVLHSSLRDYVKGVLGSEIPASYHLEAIKAQAVAAATYALRPRVDHRPEGFQVCDSYLCCQYFAGIKSGITARQVQAIEETDGQVLTYDGKPILALFSSCAGGHTESYENCFSDPLNDTFPPQPLPYLRGVPEGRLPAAFPQVSGLKELWLDSQVQTADAWSKQFRWQVKLTDGQLEGQMHYVIELLQKDKQFAPFITPPKGGRFGHIERFEITRRGVAATAMEMIVHTSAGNWVLKKELTIRNAFRNSEAQLARLKSARFFLHHRQDKLGLLKELTICGLGWGHGVGLQQTGSQGWALQGKNYRQILAHYYPAAVLEKL